MSGGITRTSLGQGGEGQTGWKRGDALTDEDIAQAMAEDPDTFEPDPASLQHAMVLWPSQPKIRVTPILTRNCYPPTEPHWIDQIYRIIYRHML
jgi:hypothetical protein